MNIKPLSQSEGPQSNSALPAWFARIDILQSLRLHKMLATVVALGTLGLGFAMQARQHPTFKATSVVYVSPSFPATMVTNQGQEYHYDNYIEEQLHLVKRDAVIAGAVRKLKPGMWQHPGENLDSAVARLQNGLTVKRDGQSYQLDISLQSGNPRYLAAIVNAVTDSYLDEVKDEEFYGRDERLDSLRQARLEVQAELTSKLQQQTQLSQALGLAEVSAGSDQIDTQVAKLRTDLMTAHEQRIESEAKLDALENGVPGVSNTALNAAAEEIIASDPSLLALKSSLSQKRALLLDQLAGMTPNHPLRKTTEEQLSEIESALQKLQTNLRDHAAASLEQKLRTDLKRASTVEAQLRSDLQSNTHQATLAAPSFQRAQMLKADIAALQTRYATLDDQTKNLELESKTPGSVHLFSAAQAPTAPAATKNKLVLRLLLPFALLLATFTVVLVDLLDRRVQAVVDVEQLLGFPPIAAIFNDRDVSMQVSDECTLRLAAGIDQAARTAGVRTILLTSLNTGGGTTSIVENLGSTLAKLGRRTLTIDSTGASSPTAYVTLNPDQVAQLGTGGFSALTPAADIRSTGVVAQPFSTKLTPLTNFMDQAFKDLTTDYDIVLIDATPILISAQTEYLARFADVTILIAEAGKTTKAQLVRASRLLERLQVPGIAAIINKIAYRRASQATREDITAFEARMKSEGFRWTSPWEKPGVPAHDDVDQAAKEDATYA
jgi:succinoglycan biosynthesis transport protein ExoP